MKAKATGWLWCVHTIGPDEVQPAPDFDTAWRWCEEQNAAMKKYTLDRGMENDPLWPEVRCVPAVWPWDAEKHAASLPHSLREFATPTQETQAGDVA